MPVTLATPDYRVKSGSPVPTKAQRPSYHSMHESTRVPAGGFTIEGVSGADGADAHLLRFVDAQVVDPEVRR